MLMEDEINQSETIQYTRILSHQPLLMLADQKMPFLIIYTKACS
jgi:hypothetical protein